jgi:hypothetical protein
MLVDWYGVNAIEWDLDSIIFNPIASIILKLLRFKFVRRALFNCVFVVYMYHHNHSNQVVYCSKFSYIKLNSTEWH